MTTIEIVCALIGGYSLVSLFFSIHESRRREKELSSYIRYMIKQRESAERNTAKILDRQVILIQAMEAHIKELEGYLGREIVEKIEPAQVSLPEIELEDEWTRL